MKISVIIPTYKPGSYLWDCLRSLRNQTMPKADFEVILVLNGCGEPYDSAISGFIASELGQMNIRYIRIAEGGVSNARNVAIEAAEGEYIAFIDDDDYVSATYLEQLLVNAAPDTVSLSNTVAFNDGEDGTVLPYRISSAYLSSSRLPECSLLRAKKFFGGPCMKLISKEIIGRRRFNVNFRNGEDSIFMFLISDRIAHVTFTSEDAIYYRRFREGSAVTRRRTFSRKSVNALRKMMEFTRIYISAPLKYDFRFYVTRILASFKELIVKQ